MHKAQVSLLQFPYILQAFPLKGFVMHEDEAEEAYFLICWKCHKVCSDLLCTVKSYACGPSAEKHLS